MSSIGIVADISGMTKPASIQPAIKRMGQYIKAMRYANKPVTHIDMYADHFDAAMKSLNAQAKEHSTPEVIGLRFGEVPVTRGGSTR